MNTSLFQDNIKVDGSEFYLVKIRFNKGIAVYKSNDNLFLKKNGNKWKKKQNLKLESKNEKVKKLIFSKLDLCRHSLQRNESSVVSVKGAFSVLFSFSAKSSIWTKVKNENIRF